MRKRLYSLLALAVVAAFAVVASVSAAGPAPGDDKNVWGWYLGVQIHPNATVPPQYGGTGPSDPSPGVPDLNVYLTGTVDRTAPIGPSRVVPLPDGTHVTLPPHQDTISALPTQAAPWDAMGAFVIPGPKATAARVRTQPDVENSLATAPLATAVRIGRSWVGLNNHLAIEYGLKAKLLALHTFPASFGGLMWAVIDDPIAFPGTCKVVTQPAGARTRRATSSSSWGWFGGLPIHVQHSGSGRPVGKPVTVYLTGPADPGSTTLPAVRSGKNLVPVRQETLSALVPAAAARPARTVFVVPGPNATAARVRTAVAPKGSAAGAPLATAIRIGTSFSKLTSHVTIEYGVRIGLLKLVPSQSQGLVWTTLADAIPYWATCS